MSEEHCGVCQHHSGLESKTKSTTWLLGILITIMVTLGSSQIMLLMGVKAELSGFQYRFAGLDQNGLDAREKLREIERRLQRLEAVDLNRRDARP